MRKLLIAICAAGALFATASYVHAEARVETLEHFMNPHSSITPAGAALFVNYNGYVYARNTGQLRVFGTVAAGTEMEDICEVFQSAHLVEVIQQVTTSDGQTDVCKY